VNGYVASFRIVAIDEESLRTTWGLSLWRESGTCHDWNVGTWITLSFDTMDRKPPAGVRTPESIQVYPKGDPTPSYDAKLPVAARMEIVRDQESAPKEDRYGKPIGSVKLDVRLRDGKSSISGETILLDCGGE
jgi:hypothetical protein